MKNISIKLTLLVLISMSVNQLFSQSVLPLYKDYIPNSKPSNDEEETRTEPSGILVIGKITKPTLTVYLPAPGKGNGVAVIICPGGGYWINASKHEGWDVAEKLNGMGYAAFVLKYRIPNDNTMQKKEIGPLQDAQRAIQIVRENATKWGINKNKIGIMGFSAGGHLASTAGTHFKDAVIANPKHISLRPDFIILGYPVISFTDSIGHRGSRDQLIGKSPSEEMIRQYSNELHVTANTPPTFLFHSKDDDAVKVENTTVFANALKKNHVPVEVYLYEHGGHGWGMHNKTSDVEWMNLVEKWMRKVMRLK